MNQCQKAVITIVILVQQKQFMPSSPEFQISLLSCRETEFHNCGIYIFGKESANIFPDKPMYKWKKCEIDYKIRIANAYQVESQRHSNSRLISNWGG